MGIFVIVSDGAASAGSSEATEGAVGFTIDREGETTAGEWKMAKSLNEFALITGRHDPSALNQNQIRIVYPFTTVGS